MLARLLSCIKEDKRNLIILILILVAVLLRCVILFFDWETLVRFVPDDSFYYFQLASNIISGHGSSMDGIHITNGYHPLWPIMISPLFLLKSIDPIIPVKLALFFSSLLTIVCGLVFYKLVKQITSSKPIGIFAFALYIFNYYIFIIESIGEPTGISNLLIILLMYLTWQHANGKAFEKKQAVLFGFIGGLSMLARTDNALYYAMFLLLGLFWFKPFRLSRYILASTVSLIILLPWFLWNLATFGTIVQSSAIACPYINHLNADTTVLQQLLSGDISAFTELIGTSVCILRYSQLSLLFYIVLGIGITVLISKDPKIRKGMALALSGLLIVFILFFLHYAVAMYYREWHVASAAPFVLLIIVLTIHFFVSQVAKLRWLWVAYGTLAFGFSSFMFIRAIDYPMFYHQLDILDMKDWVLQQPKGSVAIYDGGLMQYLTDGWVLSIDGNVNNSAQQAVVEARVFDYLKENGVEYLVGWEWIINRYRKVWPEPIDDKFQEFSMPPTRGSLYIMKHPHLYTISVFRFWRLK
jgi:hypothetical protein